jgi:CheY-like chemotaxis protein
MGKKVLILEDQGGILFPLAERLRDDGYEVICASDLYTADQALEDMKLDALILDLNMDAAGLDPALLKDTMDGQLTGWIWLRQHPEYHAKAIVYSAYLASLSAHASAEDAATLRNIVQISKREEGHVRAVVAAVKKITREAR